MSGREAVEQFLIAEARLLDEMRYEEWFTLWDEDGLYHIPVEHDAPAGARRVSIIKDDFVRLRQRVDRLKTGSVLAMEGQEAAMRRLVSNVEILSESVDGQMEAAANFLVGVARTAKQQIWMGRSVYNLRRAASGFRIKRKTVLLINSRHELPLLQFLL